MLGVAALKTGSVNKTTASASIGRDSISAPLTIGVASIPPHRDFRSAVGVIAAASTTLVGFLSSAACCLVVGAL